MDQDHPSPRPQSPLAEVRVASSPPAGRARSTAGWWVAMGVLCYAIFGLQLMNHRGADELPDPADHSSVQLKLMGRYAIGIRVMGEQFEAARASTESSFQELAAQVDELSDTGVIDQLRATAVIAEILNPQEALSRLDEVDAALDQVDDEAHQELAQDAALFRRLFESAQAARPAPDDTAQGAAAVQDAAGVAPPLTSDERQRLLDRHEWFGRLAIAQAAPPGDPDRAALDAEGRNVMIWLLSMACIVVVAVLCGFVLLIIASVLLATGRLKLRHPLALQKTLSPGEPPAFLQTAVLFLGLFIGLQLALAVVSFVIGSDAIMQPLAIGALWVVALIAFWPLAQGRSFRELRWAYGWHANGRGIGGVFREIGAGAIAYVAGLPIMLCGILLTVAIMGITSSKTTHPIQEQVEIDSALDAIMLYLLAVVWAPLVEETIFRGALFHHLRQGARVLASALATAFVFAIIHPQGYAGVPVLMALAVNFALMREWRGSLIAPITAHAINNGFVITLLIVLVAE